MTYDLIHMNFHWYVVKRSGVHCQVYLETKSENEARQFYKRLNNAFAMLGEAVFFNHRVELDPINWMTELNELRREVDREYCRSMQNEMAVYWSARRAGLGDAGLSLSSPSGLLRGLIGRS